MGTVEEHLALGQSPSKSNFVVRFWRGEYSLGVSYWAFGVGTYVVVGLTDLLTYLLAYILGANDQQAMLAILLISAIPMIWYWVGVWSSADNHVVRTGRKGWASAAKVMVAIGLIGSIGDAAHLLQGTSGGLVSARRGLDKSDSSGIGPAKQISDVRAGLDAPFIVPSEDKLESFPGQLDRAMQELSPVDRTRVLEAIGFLAFSTGAYVKEHEPEKFAKMSETDLAAKSFAKMYRLGRENGRDMTLRKYVELADEFKTVKPESWQQYKASIAAQEHTSQKQMTSASSGP